MTWQSSAGRLVFRNRPFRRTLLAIILFGAALVTQPTLHKLVFSLVIGSAEQFAPMILVEYLAALLALPFWMWVSDCTSKYRAVIFPASGSVSVACFPLGRPRRRGLYVMLIVLRGSSFTSIFFLSNSMAAGVVDSDPVASGRQRTGLYFSVWGMGINLSIAFGVLLGTVLLSRQGFEPSVRVHSDSVLFPLMMVYGWLPFLLIVLVVPLLWNFPIIRDRQQKLR